MSRALNILLVGLLAVAVLVQLVYTGSRATEKVIYAVTLALLTTAVFAQLGYVNSLVNKYERAAAEATAGGCDPLDKAMSNPLQVYVAVLDAELTRAVTERCRAPDPEIFSDTRVWVTALCNENIVHAEVRAPRSEICYLVFKSNAMARKLWQDIQHGSTTRLLINNTLMHPLKSNKTDTVQEKVAAFLKTNISQQEVDVFRTFLTKNDAYVVVPVAIDSPRLLGTVDNVGPCVTAKHMFTGTVDAEFSVASLITQRTSILGWRG